MVLLGRSEYNQLVIEMADKQFRLQCPFCGYTTLVDKVKKDGYKALENWSIDWSVLQVRDVQGGPGRPAKDQEQRARQMSERTGGFPLDMESCMSIVEMAKDPKWQSLSMMVAARIEKIYDAYREAGLIPHAADKDGWGSFGLETRRKPTPKRRRSPRKANVRTPTES